MPSRPLSADEAARRCPCGNVLVCRVGDRCPRCRRYIADVRVMVGAIVISERHYGPEHAATVASVLGVRGRVVVRGGRVLGVVEGGR